MFNRFVRMFRDKKSFVNVGLPLFVLVIGGSFGMTEFSKVRYEYRGQKRLTPEEAKEFGISMKKPGEISLEKEFERIQNLDIDTWENKRGPRPWEADNPTNTELQNQAKAKALM